VTHIPWAGLWRGVCGGIVGCHGERGRWGPGNGIKALGGKDGVRMVIADAVITMEGDWWEGLWCVGDDERREDDVRLIGGLDPFLPSRFSPSRFSGEVDQLGSEGGVDG